jgi:tetratricopeptide (TPR) repeat protein
MSNGNGERVTGVMRLVGVALVVWGVGAGHARACASGDTDYGLLGEEAVIKRSPVGNFEYELRRVVGELHKNELVKVAKEPKVKELENGETNTQHFERLQMGWELEKTGLAKERQAKVLGDAMAYRLLIDKMRRGTPENQRPEDVGKAVERLEDTMKWPVLSAELPAQHRLYLQGMRAYVLGDLKGARECFAGVVGLPEDRGRVRDVWAAYMMGRTLQSEPSKAVAWYAKVRALAEAGHPDPLGLAAESLGWEARARMDMGEYAEALRLYLSQLNTDAGGDVQSSIGYCVSLVLKDQASCLRGAQDSLTRDVVTAELVGNAPRAWGLWDSDDSRDATALARWTEALSTLKGGRKGGQENADRLAWVCYQGGRFELAQKWVDLSAPESFMARWVKAKLLVRAGKDAQAQKVLEALAQEKPDPGRTGYYYPCWEQTHVPMGELVSGEIGVLKVAQGQYVQAAVIFAQLKADYEAQVIAERVLTMAELKGLADQAGVSEIFRECLARRLARAGKFEQAAVYFKGSLAESVKELDGLVRSGRDVRNGAGKRAGNLWKGAQILWREGDVILGAIYVSDDENVPRDKEASRFELSPQMLKRSGDTTLPARRYSPQFAAADMAWEAAGLMPDESDETARVLCTAGTWIKYLDPKAADRFYKALVRRCGKTELGKAAQKKRWFPEMVQKGNAG